jgi:hypothetical protein
VPELPNAITDEAFRVIKRGVDLKSAKNDPSNFLKGMIMNAGKTLFAQLMDFLPWSTFNRYVARYGGDKGVRTLTCAEQFRVMAFAQLTYRESLRDIEVSLSAQASSCTTWDFASRCGARRWPTPTNRATGASMPISLLA